MDLTETTLDSGLRWRHLLKLPQTWGTVIAKSFTDPVWFFITDWFPIYLVAKGISLKSGLIAVWIPFIAADLGNFFGGLASGYLIKRGWSLGAARKAIVVFGGTGVMLLIPTIFTVNLGTITLLFALATFSYASFSTIANVLPSDLFKSDSVASVSGLSGTGAGIGTIIAFKFIGYFSDANQGVGHAFIRYDHHYCGPGAIPGNDSCSPAGSQHACHSARAGSRYLIRAPPPWPGSALETGQLFPVASRISE